MPICAKSTATSNPSINLSICKKVNAGHVCISSIKIRNQRNSKAQKKQSRDILRNQSLLPLVKDWIINTSNIRTLFDSIKKNIGADNSRYVHKTLDIAVNATFLFVLHFISNILYKMYKMYKIGFAWMTQIPSYFLSEINSLSGMDHKTNIKLKRSFRKMSPDTRNCEWNGNMWGKQRQI